MTTKVTVDAHAGWPVEVTTIDRNAQGEEVAGSKSVVPPHTTQDFYVHSHRELHIKELPSLPEAPTTEG